MRRWLKVLVIVVVAVLLLALAAGLLVRRALLGSLALCEGEVEVDGLSAAVTIERDALGVPAIRGENRTDIARALGFVHAQERFFQMDLLRRRGAGELAELFGPAAVETDKAARLHSFRTLAARVIDRLPENQRRIQNAYTQGVNAGLAAQAQPPFEYLLLRQDPAPWSDADSVLVVYGMYFTLNDSTGGRESARGLVLDLLDPELAAFLAPHGTSWDAAVDGGSLEVPPMPQITVPADTAMVAAAISSSSGDHTPPPLIGSNNWAVAGSRTADGRAILANDMHLPLALPNTWYRASLEWSGGDDCGTSHRVTGVTLPGSPVMIAGSTPRIAWGFTNSYGDWTDLVILEMDGERYLTPDGPRDFDTRVETIKISGGEPERFEVRSTIWGPVLDEDYLGRPRALRWIAHSTQGANMGLLNLEHVAHVEAALAVANRTGLPPQNFVCADHEGNIGWTIIGSIPIRRGLTGEVPTSWADGSRGWFGWLEPEAYPRIVNPPTGQIWTANARVVSGESLEIIGDGGYALGARAGQIRDDLMALTEADERDMLATQLDDRALFLEHWRRLAFEILTPEAIEDHPGRQQFRTLVEDTWTGKASTDSQAYRLVRAFRFNTFELIYGRFTVPCSEADQRFDIYRFSQWEDSVWRLVTERPEHLLGPDHGSWEEALLSVVDDTVEWFTTEIGPDPELWTWGHRNTVTIRHPISRAVPQLAGWLDMPGQPLPGDSSMPRVQGPAFGASERFAVSPGRESDAIFHMPGGQSGHPLSPYYRAGHDAWAEGKTTRFLPGEAETVLTLIPTGG